MATNTDKTFLKGNLTKDIKSLKMYLSFNLPTPLLRMYSMEIILNLPKEFSNKPQLMFIMLKKNEKSTIHD